MNRFFQRIQLYSLFPVLVAALIVSCATPADHGTLVRSDEVKNTFENAEIFPDHIYYYYGPQAAPEAIIAIHKSFTLQNAKNFWVRVDITEKMLQDWNRIISNDTRVKFPYRGSQIFTPRGEKAGYWYSKQTHTVIRSADDNVIVVFTPSPTLEKRSKSPFRNFEY